MTVFKLESEATSLPTEPQPLPRIFKFCVYFLTKRMYAN